MQRNLGHIEMHTGPSSELGLSANIIFPNRLNDNEIDTLADKIATVVLQKKHEKIGIFRDVISGIINMMGASF